MKEWAGLYFPILIGAEIYFCGTNEKILSEIKEVKPTILSAVPRLYENIFKKIRSQINKTNFFNCLFIKKNFFVHRKYSQKNTNIFEKVIITIFLKIILKNEVLKVFGKKIKVLISGGAALNLLLVFFLTN